MDMYQKREMRKNKKMDESTKSLPSTSINWYPGHMAKTKREIKENINLIDIVYEVIDARMPISSKIVDIDNLIQEKPRILIVTKYDLCDKEKTDIILKKYQELGHELVAVDLINGKNIKAVIDKTLNILEGLNKKRIAKGMKPRRARVLVVGVPNVGKSTLINRLVGKKATSVGNRPGVTKSLSWIRIHEKIELLDSPGILWPKLDNQEHALNLAALSSIREEVLPMEEVAFHILNRLSQYYPDKLQLRYSIDEFNEKTPEKYLEVIAKKRGALLKGGLFDYDKVYLTVVRDVRDGLINNITFDNIEDFDSCYNNRT